MYLPGELGDDARRKKFEELSARTKVEGKAAARAASARRRERLEGLERDYGIYDVATIADNGDTARRVDVVILSAGFQKSEAAKVNALAEMLKTALLKVDPFRNYAPYINFHRVSLNDAGPASAHIPYRVVNGMLNCETRKALEYADHAPAADLVVVLCNTPPCRATESGPVIAIDPSLDLGRTFLHEMGHAFGRLLDEYVEPANEKIAAAPLTPEQEDSAANVTTLANPRRCKWHYWIPETWNAPYAPNHLPPQHKVGSFEGAALYGLNSYRPEASCVMQGGDRYCVVCFEQIERQFYRLISPIDDTRPAAPRVALWADDSAAFEADAIQIASFGKLVGEFHGLWYVDCRNRRPTQAKNLTTSLTLQASELGEGFHEVALRVDFADSRIRRDHGWLSDTRSWSVLVSRQRRPRFVGPKEVKAEAGKLLRVEAQLENPDPARFRLAATDLPPGAVYSGGVLAWTPSKLQTGGWRPRFILSDGLHAASGEIEISVVDSPDKTNYRPIFLPMEPVAATVGEPLELPIDVADVDGDNLVFSCGDLPAGATLDAYDGVIRWTPTALQSGRHPGITIDVWDGTNRVRGSVEIMVEENPSFRREAVSTAEQLRSSAARTRAEALRKLASFGRGRRFLEAARLLRDQSPLVRTAALDVLRPLADTGDEALLGMMTKDLAPQTWSFTDDGDALSWLATLAAKGRGDKADLDLLRSSLKGIEKYNRDRGVFR